MKGTIIRAISNEEEPVEFDNWLEFGQEVVGGWVELVRTKDNKTLLVNEEGLMLHLPFNKKASAMYAGEVIVGDVVLIDIKKEDMD